jgi:hypothetical protein
LEISSPASKRFGECSRPVDLAGAHPASVAVADPRRVALVVAVDLHPVDLVAEAAPEEALREVVPAAVPVEGAVDRHRLAGSFNGGSCP